MTIEMKMDQRYEQGRKKGRNEGEQNRDKELITKWLQKGKSIAEIAVLRALRAAAEYFTLPFAESARAVSSSDLAELNSAQSACV